MTTPERLPPPPDELRALIAAEREAPPVPDTTRARLARRLARGRGPRRRAIGAAVAVVAAAAVLAYALWPETGRPRPVTGPGTHALGAHVMATLQADAALAWRMAGESVHVRQRAGTVRYRVARALSVETPVGRIDCDAGQLTVEILPMRRSHKQAMAAAGAAVLVAVTVHQGVARFSSDAGSMTLEAGQRAEAAAGEAPERSWRGEEGPALAAEAPPTIDYGDDPAGALRLEGQVIDADELPVGGATVTISARPPRTVVTEADGSFFFDGLLPRRYQLTAHGDTRAAGPVSVQLERDTEPVILRMVPGATLAVEVRDAETGRPVPQAQVEVGGEVGEVNAVTDLGGVATVRGLGRGFYTLAASAPGYARGRTMIEIAGSPGTVEQRTVLLEAGAPVSGRVLGPDGAPIAGAEVSLQRASDIFVGDGERVLSGPDGRWQIDAVDAGSHRFEGRHEAHAPGSSGLVSVDGRTPTGGIDVRLAAGRAISGHVLTAGGAPAPFAEVRLGTDDWSGPERRVHADARGQYRIGGLPALPVRLSATGNGASAEPLVVDLADGDAIADLRLTSTGTIAGVVVDEHGTPVPDTQVIASPTSGPLRQRLGAAATTLTDQAGRFRLGGIGNGEYRVRATTASSRRVQLGAGRSDASSARASAGVEDLRLVMATPGAVIGRVRDARGRVPDHFTIELAPLPPVPFAGEDGAFRLGALPPGRYRVRVRGPGFADTEGPVVEVGPGETADAGTITVDPGRVVAGRVVDGGGQPVAGARILLGMFVFGSGDAVASDVLGERGGQRSGVSGPDGRFAIAGAGPAALLAVAEHARGRSPATAIAAGRQDVEVELIVQEPGAAEGQVLAGNAPVEAIVEVTSVASPSESYTVRSGPDGRFRFDRLAPGAYRARAQRSGQVMVMVGGAPQPAHAELEIEPGRVTSVRIEIPGGARVTVSVAGLGDSDTVLVHLVEGEVAATSGAELMAALATVPRDRQRVAPVLVLDDGPAMPATFEAVAPGRYTACAAILAPLLPDSPGEHGMALQVADDTPVRCRALTVGSTDVGTVLPK